MPFASIYGTIFSVSDKTPGMKTERGKKNGKTLWNRRRTGRPGTAYLWKQNAGCIAQYLNGDRTGAFITLGDPAVYSTFMYTLPYIEEAGVEVEVVPGVTSFCAVADSMKIPLVAWNEDLVVAPVRKNSSEDLGRVLREHDNVVLMKPSTDPQALLKALKENHLEDRFVLITKTGTGEERLVTDFEELEQYDIPYLSTVIIKKQGRQ